MSIEVKVTEPTESVEDSEKKDSEPNEADIAAEEQHIKEKYGFVSKPPPLAQRKISKQGGKQYFDSGDYNMHSSNKDRQEIASHPHALNPHLRAKQRGSRPPHRSQLVARNAPPQQAPSSSRVPPQPSKLAASKLTQSPLAQQ